MLYKIKYNEYLKHHGIDGQKWGVRNGPPYPLTTSQLSTRERKYSIVKSYEKRQGMPKEEYIRACNEWNKWNEFSLPGKSREKVYNEFDNNLDDYQRKSHIVARPIDDYFITALHKGHNQYKIINVQRVDNEPIDDDELFNIQVFGLDWKRLFYG